MNESLLKKQFKESDLQRARNLVNKKFGDKTRIQTGYQKTKKFYKEGDIWEERGKTWTIKNGLKQNITKLDKAKKAVKVPLCCPKCGGPMKHWLAKKMYKIHGFCFDPCTVEMETELREHGLYKQYEERMMQGGMKAFIKDLEQWMLDQINTQDTFVTEQGVVENWKNNSKKENEVFKEKIYEYIDWVKEHIKDKD